MRSCPKRSHDLLSRASPFASPRGAGDAAAFPDDLYEAAGATFASDAASLVEGAGAVVTVGRPSDEVLAALRPETVIVGFLNPLGDPSYLQRLAQAKITALAMEMIPRITRAQSMDALSSQSNIAGYKAVLLAASALPKFFPMLTTAAGTIRRRRCWCSAPASPDCRRSRPPGGSAPS